MNRLDAGKRFEFNWYSRRSAMNLGGIRLMQLGTVCCQPGYEVAPHTQWCHEISYFVSGSGRFVVDGSQTDIHPNDLFLTPLESAHSILVDQSEALHYCYLGFQFDEGCLDGEIAQLRAFFMGTHPLSVPGNQDLMMAFYRAVGELSQSSHFSPMLLTGYIQSILILSMRLFLTQTAAPRILLNPSGSSGEITYLIMRAIDEHLSSLESVQDLARRLGYHPCYLSHHFKARTGMTLQEYIAQKKVERAVGLMRFSPLTVTQIAERMGFSTLQSFSKAFKRITGAAPRHYIRMNRLRSE